MALSWSSAAAGSVAYDSQYDYSADDDTNMTATLDVNILGVNLEGDIIDNNFNWQPSLKVHVGKHISNHHSNVRTVSVNLGDQDNGEYQLHQLQCFPSLEC